MPSHGLSRRAGWRLFKIGWCCLCLATPVLAQTPAASPPAAAAGTDREAQLEARIKELESMTASLPEAAPATSREAQLEARIKQLESLVNRLSTQVERLAAPPAPRAAGTGGAGAGAAAGDASVGTSAGASAAVAGPSAAPLSSRFDMPSPPVSIPGKVRFGPGFEIKTDDDEYVFQFHNLTQLDHRGYWPTPSAAVPLYRSTFGIPRQWWIFNGRLTKPFEYSVVPAFGFDSLNLLDAFLNIHYDDRLQLKIGRYKTPFTYEFYNVPINGMINPERSLFFNNYGLNRDVGAMAWGQLFQKKFDYAVGLFNGSRNFYVDRNSTPDVVAYLDGRPLGDWEGSVFENLHLGGSVDFGNQFQAVVPQVLRTNVATTGSSFFGVPFLAFNNNVIESGDRALWDAHTALYYRRLSAIAEYAGGFQDYATTAAPFNRSRVPIQSFYVQAAYFLTGETVSARGMLKPLRDFDVRPGRRGPGAIELASRYSYLDVGRQVFTDGLADRNLWSNRAWLLDVGVNWYLTQYVKFYFGWQHAEFGDPVSLGPGRFQFTNNMLWTRFQVFF